MATLRLDSGSFNQNGPGEALPQAVHAALASTCGFGDFGLPRVIEVERANAFGRRFGAHTGR
jgi:hypothetical protein